MNDIIAQLISELGEAKVSTGETIAERNTSYWDASPMQGKALVRVANTQDVSTVLRLCDLAAQPVVILGGNTGGVEGQHSLADEVIISLENMNAIEEIDPVGHTATVQAGCLLQSLQNAVFEHDLIFALDLGSRGSCTIGGNVSTNAGGLNVIRYGMMRDLTLGVEAVLADGTVVSSLNAMLKNNTGYDIKQLFIGAEGTLGVVTRVVVKLHEKPSSVNTALFAAESFDKIVQMLHHMRRASGGILNAFEFMDGEHYRAITVPGNRRAPLSRDYPFYGVVEYCGVAQVADDSCFQNALEEAFEKNIIVSAVVAKSGSEREEIWAVREDFEILLQNKPYFIYDVSLKIREMGAYIQRVAQEIQSLWPNAICISLAHVGDGNLHFFVAPMIDGNEQELRDLSDRAVYEPLRALKGSVSAEHGIGFEKKAHLNISRSIAELALMKSLKRTLDPNNIMGRGRIFDLG